jgi:hypothetical protein
LSERLPLSLRIRDVVCCVTSSQHPTAERVESLALGVEMDTGVIL